MRNFFDTSRHWTKHAEDVANMSEQEIEQHTDHLDICPDCKYVRCSCGACHSQKCNHTCSYETGYSEKDMRS